MPPLIKTDCNALNQLPTHFKLLRNFLKEKEPLAIAFSGGLDSTALTLFCAANSIRHVCFTIIGPHITDYEIRKIISQRQSHILPHYFFYHDYRENEYIRRNNRDRCYYCKLAFFKQPLNFFSPAHTIVDGTNSTDMLKFRPGIKALYEHGILSPFAAAGMDRKQVSSLAVSIGLGADNFASRSCILTRFDYGVQLDFSLVLKVRAIEDFLLDQGISAFRFRVMGPEKYLLQVDGSQKKYYQKVETEFEKFFNELELGHFDVQFIPFNQISGYFDR